MAWIGDVVPYSTILSTWGNNIRNHIVQAFANATERDQHPLSDGTLNVPLDTGILERKHAGAWRPVPTAALRADCAAHTLQPGTVQPNTGRAFTINVGPGYRQALVSYYARIGWAAAPASGYENAIVLLYLYVGASVWYGTNTTVRYNQDDIMYSWLVDLDVNNANQLAVDITNNNANASGIVLMTQADRASHSAGILLIP